MFFESSTRTSASFELAAKRLSADTLSLKASGSSVDKGESLKDTALTLSAYDPDVIVIRHPQIGAPHLVARVTEAHVVNAGDGKHQHPTQALLDLYTINEALGRLEGVHVAIVGDVLHSRVARSLVQALRLVGARVTLVGPPPLVPAELGDVSHDIDAIRDADVVYVLRMQRERMEEGANYVPTLREYSARWCVTPERLRPGQRVMHPGPMNRGVEIDPRVADSPDALVVDQVRAGLVVRMAVLYDLLTTGPGRGRDRRGGGMTSSSGKEGRDDLVVRGARVLDPAGGVDAVLDVRVDGGTIAQLGSALDANGHRVIDGAGLVLAPAFVDPHVHLRTPGREDEETIASGTAAAAAGGYCAILAMPNTVAGRRLDRHAARAARPRGASEAEVPVGFTAAITVGQQGTQLTEMGELADAGAAAFTDDGRPVATAGLMRRALEYNAITGRPLALHCEEPTLTKGGHMHMGTVSAELGLGGWPSLGESLGVARELSLAADTRQPLHLMHLSARESIELLRRAQAAGVAASGEVTPHHLCLTDEAVRSLDSNLKMNPPLRVERRPRGADRGAERRHDRGDRDRPRAALARGEGRPVRGGAVRRHRPRDGVRRALHAPRRAGPRAARDAARADVGRPGADLRPRAAARRGGRAGELRPARPAASWRVREDRFRSRRRTRGCSASG